MTLSVKDAIGIFDSGLGGITVLKAVRTLLPYEKIIYYADSANCPYGSKSKEEIVQLVKQVVEELLKMGVKIIVVACNTATSAAIHEVRKAYPHITFIAIEPAVKPATERSKSGTIGVIATERTITGESLRSLCERYSQKCKIILQPTPKLASLVERNLEQSDQTREILIEYLTPLIEQGADKIVLGCTHYPFLRKQIKEVVGPDIEILEPAEAVAKQTKKCLEEQNLLDTTTTSGKTIFTSSLSDEYNKSLEKRYNDYDNKKTPTNINV